MKQHIHKIRHKAHKHRTFLLTTTIIFLVLYAISFINNLYTSQQVDNSFEKSYEKQSIAQLNAYSFGVDALIQTRFDNPIQSLTNFVNLPKNRQALLSSNPTDVDVALGDLVNTDNRIDSVSVLNSQGHVVAGVDHQGQPNTKDLGIDLSGRSYFVKTKATTQPYISDVIHSSFTGKNLMSFSVPVVDNTGHLHNVVNAYLYLQNLASTISLPRDISGLYFSLVDSKGNLLISKGKALNGITNVADSDPAVRNLVTGQPSGISSEVNYLNDKTFAQARTLSIDGNKFYVLSYYQQDKYNHDLQVVKADYRRAIATSRLRGLVAFSVIALILFRVVRRYEETDS